MSRKSWPGSRAVGLAEEATAARRKRGELIQLQKRINEASETVMPESGFVVPVITGRGNHVLPSAAVLRIRSVRGIVQIPGAGMPLCGTLFDNGILYPVIDFNYVVNGSSCENDIYARIVLLQPQCIALRVPRLGTMRAAEGEVLAWKKIDIESLIRKTPGLRSTDPMGAL